MEPVESRLNKLRLTTRIAAHSTHRSSRTGRSRSERPPNAPGPPSLGVFRPPRVKDARLVGARARPADAVLRRRLRAPCRACGCGSTASANPKIDVEVPVRIVSCLPAACGASSIGRGCSPCCFALLDRPASILVNMPALLCHPALTLFNEGRKSDGPIIRDFDVWRGASDAHGGGRGINLHVTGLRHLAGSAKWPCQVR
jgi:hypothetical protein